MKSGSSTTKSPIDKIGKHTQNFSNSITERVLHSHIFDFYDKNGKIF